VKSGTFKAQASLGPPHGRATAKVKLFSSTPGRARLVFSAKRGAYPGDPTRLPLHATLLLGTAAGQCGELFFRGPSPTCVHDPTKGRILCK
jgi:hypothetical protein